ncbi:hypothetical protein [Moorena producens]|uniref:hypothetical protein n=1 Tax=Moorena producens TaxID=1155739 RepID=UPI0011EA67D2|nr:hypothetical protein [Moorena producens]
MQSASGGNHGSRSWGRPPRPRCLPKTALHRCANSTQLSAVSFMTQATSPVTTLQHYSNAYRFYSKAVRCSLPYAHGSHQVAWHRLLACDSLADS